METLNGKAGIYFRCIGSTSIGNDEEGIWEYDVFTFGMTSCFYSNRSTHKSYKYNTGYTYFIEVSDENIRCEIVKRITQMAKSNIIFDRPSYDSLTNSILGDDIEYYIDNAHIFANLSMRAQLESKNTSVHQNNSENNHHDTNASIMEIAAHKLIGKAETTFDIKNAIELLERLHIVSI
jgi:hypothetical protein